MKQRFLQKIADAIYNMTQRTKTETDFGFWYNTGMNLNSWCVKRDIWLS